MKCVPVHLGERSYEILVGSGILKDLGALTADRACAHACLLAIDTEILDTHGLAAEAALEGYFDVASCDVIATEDRKSTQAVAVIWTAMLNAGCDRSTPVIAMGGGITGDLAGFAAATFMRGVPLIQVPTTLLAMVDASIGGKTGINLPVSRGDASTVMAKNMAGAFWQPKLVVADVDTLSTLDDRQFRCGLAECVKHAMLGDNGFMAFLEESVAAILDRDTACLIDLVTRSATIKAEVVAADERESGRREVLNLGHTFGHAIEPMKELDLMHGEAVSIGLVAAAACGVELGLLPAEMADRVASLLSSMGLPIEVPQAVPARDLAALMAMDKKTRGGELRVALPRERGVELVDSTAASSLARGIEAAWQAVGALA